MLSPYFPLRLWVKGVNSGGFNLIHRFVHGLVQIVLTWSVLEAENH